MPGSQKEECRREGLGNRRTRRLRAVTAFMQGDTARIQSHRHNVLLDAHAEGVALPCLEEGHRAVLLLHGTHHGLLHDRLDVRGGEELRVHRSCLRNPEAPVPRNQFAEGQGQSALKELLVAGRPKASQLEEHALRGSEPEVGSRDCLRIAEKAHSAVIHRRNIVTEFRNFPLQYRL